MATATATEPTLRKHLSVTDGFVLYTSAVLGQSLIVLPSIAARHAGPWSILIWAASPPSRIRWRASWPSWARATLPLAA